MGRMGELGGGGSGVWAVVRGRGKRGGSGILGPQVSHTSFFAIYFGGWGVLPFKSYIGTSRGIGYRI